MKKNLNTNSIEKMLNDNMGKSPIKVKKIQYKMDFKCTEVIVKLGLN